MQPIVRYFAMLSMVPALLLSEIPALRAELPNPVLQAVFPAGAQAGTTVTVTLEGTALDGLRDVRLTAPGFTAEKIEGNRFNVSIAATTPSGVYDLRAITDHGLSSPR